MKIYDCITYFDEEVILKIRHVFTPPMEARCSASRRRCCYIPSASCCPPRRSTGRLPLAGSGFASDKGTTLGTGRNGRSPASPRTPTRRPCAALPAWTSRGRSTRWRTRWRRRRRRGLSNPGAGGVASRSGPRPWDPVTSASQRAPLPGRWHGPAARPPPGMQCASPRERTGHG